MNKKLKAYKMPRRVLTVTMSCVFMISLSSCSGAKNSYGSLDTNAIYATSGEHSVTNGELWNELKWDSSSKLENQITNVILNDYITKINLVMNNRGKYDSLTDEQKQIFDNSKETFDALGEKYSKRLIDYVVQDIYNFNYSNNSYWDNIEALSSTSKKLLEVQYADEMYLTYKEVIDTNQLANATEESNSYLEIATNLSELYYPLLAKELLAEEKISEEVKEKDDEDDDPEDEMLGYFKNSEYISKFKSEYANKFNLNLILIRFSTDDEYNDTLRAFGLKVYNKHLYYIAGEGKSYVEYCKYYDDLSNTEMTRTALDITSNFSDSILEIYIQMYNYVYSGYRKALSSNLTDLPQINELNDLRRVTSAIINTYSKDQYDAAVETLMRDNADIVTYTRDELDEIGSSFSTYVYDTLELDGISYSTSSQSYNSSYYIAYKFGDEDTTDNIYNKDLTDDDILEIVQNEENAEIKDALHALLVREKITESTISSYITEAKKDVKVKIYNEATEIEYSRSNSSYSKTLSGNKNKNVLATIEYNKKTWNLNISADDEDSKSLLIPGTSSKYGMFEELERESGQTTAIDLIARKLIKTTKAYEETLEDIDFYNSYIEAILYSFANDGYSSSGYPSSIGKYNFLMLYFHTADIQEIIREYYRVQYASAKLLTDYSDSKLIEFFKYYTDKSYENYFSLSGSRLVVYYDGDDDNEPDEIPTDKSGEEYADCWVNQTPNIAVDLDLNSNGVIEASEKNLTYKEIAKYLVYEIYNEINASTDAHSTKLESLVEEINQSARVAYDDNPVLVENQWAKYRKVGLRVKIETFEVTNSSTDVDFTLKQRLYDYARGYSDTDGVAGESDGDTKYQYFINATQPTEYIEPLSSSAVYKDNTQIIETNDGFNLILVTQGSSTPSAKWEELDFDDDLLTNIILKYNEKYITIDNIYNSEDKLSFNQIKLYVLEYVSSQTSNLTPSELSDATSTFLSPVLTRFTGSETQRIILLEYIESDSGKLHFTTEGYDEEFEKIMEINKNSADSYNYIYNDTTETSNSFPDWWTKLNDLKEAK